MSSSCPSKKHCVTLWCEESSSFLYLFSTFQTIAKGLIVYKGLFKQQSYLALCSVQSLSHVQLFATHMDYSIPGLPVHHQPLEFTQTHVRQVSDAIQPSRPLSSPSPPTFNLSQLQGLFK